MGSTASQSHVDEAPFVRLPTNRPFAIAWRPVGAVMWYVNEALSRGWSFAGNHDDAPCGSPITIAPSPVARKPEPSRSGRAWGTPSYRATMVRFAPLARPV